MPIDPTEDERYAASSETEFSDLSTEAQVAVREVLDNEFVDSILIYNGSRDHFAVKVPVGDDAGDVAERLVETGLSLWVSFEGTGIDEASVIVYEVHDDNE